MSVTIICCIGFVEIQGMLDDLKFFHMFLSWNLFNSIYFIYITNKNWWKISVYCSLKFQTSTSNISGNISLIEKRANKLCIPQLTSVNATNSWSGCYHIYERLLIEDKQTLTRRMRTTEHDDVGWKPNTQMPSQMSDIFDVVQLQKHVV